jgi:hypothetical protein
LNQPEAQETRDDQKDRYDVIKQLRHDQDEDAGEQRDNRLKCVTAMVPMVIFLFPVLKSSVLGSGPEGHPRSRCR